MKDPVITYRGATCRLSELDSANAGKTETTRNVRYRGATGTVDFRPHVEMVRAVRYRGATAEVEV